MPDNPYGWQHHRARVAVAVRFGDTEAEAKARADLAECRASDYIRNLLDGKQLAQEGIARLSVLLTPEDGP